QAALAGLVELLVERPELRLADGQHRLDRLELVAQLAQLVLEALGLLLELALLRGERLVHGGAEVGDLLLHRELLVALPLLDPLEVARADVEEDSQARGRALEVPDVADRAGQLDVAHPLAADLRARDLDAAFVADDALVPNPLVLAAVALPVLRRTEDALVEQ